MTTATPRLVCLSGSLHPESRTERLATWCASALTALGAQVSLFASGDLDIPHYRPLPAERTDSVIRMLKSIKEADGVLLVSPTYHGTVSGVLKNALDYVNDLGSLPQPFLDGRPVGCVAVAAGDQGAVSTLTTLRTVAHALRGWPTPLGVTAWGRATEFVDDSPVDNRLIEQMRIMLGQVLSMSILNARRRSRAEQMATLRIGIDARTP
jgi:FMN reductase